MIQQHSPPPAATLLDFQAAIEADAEVEFKRLGFDDKIGRKRLADFVHEGYVLELMIIAQMARWYEIGLVTPQELNVVHPATLMIDLRQRIAASPKEHVRSSGRWAASVAKAAIRLGQGKVGEPGSTFSRQLCRHRRDAAKQAAPNLSPSLGCDHGRILAPNVASLKGRQVTHHADVSPSRRTIAR